MAAKLILIFSTVSVIPLLVSCFVLYHISVNSLEASMEETTAIFSSQIASDMNKFVKDYDALTRSLLVNEGLMEKLSTDIPISEQITNRLYYRTMITKLITLEDAICSVTILNDEGEYYQYDQNGKSLDYETLMEQDWLSEQMENSETVFVTPLHDDSYYDRSQDQIVVTFGRKVYDFNGRYAGLILVDLPPASIVKLSDAFLLERNQYNIKINITDESGGLIYDSDLSSGRVNYSEINQEELLMYQKDPENYLVIENTTEELGMRVNTVIPRSNMFLRISFIQRVTAVLMLVLILVIVASSILFSRNMVRLIRKLQGSMKRLEEGSYELIEAAVGDDEIGSLVKSYNHMVGKMKSLIEEVYTAGIRQKNAQFLALRTQINPHFLFNTLESIRIKAILNGDDAVADMVKLLAKMFRTSLDSDKKNYKVQDEMEHVRSYIRLQNIRFDDVITLEEEIEPKLYQAQMMSIIFQPVVENCFKYGSKESGVPICISIKGKLTEENSMVFTIRDNGKGMSRQRLEDVRSELLRAEEGAGSQENPQEGSQEDSQEDSQERTQEYKMDSKTDSKTDKNSHRIGLRNIAGRLRLRYGNEGSLRIVSSDESGTVIEVRVPYTE